MRRILVVSNPFAGGGEAVEVMEMYKRFADEQSDYEYYFYLTQAPEDFDGISSAVDAYKPDVVSIVGGDGTLNEVLNVENVREKIIHIVPAGTGNDFHRLIYGECTVREAFELSKSENIRKYDTGKCNDRYFINGVGIGFDGAVANETVRMKLSFMPMHWKYWISILKNILFYKSTDVKLTYDGKTETRNAFLVDVANGTECAGSFKISPLSKPDDGLLNLVLIRNVSRLKRMAKLNMVKKGKHMKDSAVYHQELKEIKIESPKKLYAHLDGEIMSSTVFDISISDQLKFVV
ncbi:MAG: YegS/Rv2252/BmrU family lipid kinase [Bacteroidia bacterium]|nr:YegS/Rv2252/BmrU family lipid kinase [Bacteroidia bacterium]